VTILETKIVTNDIFNCLRQVAKWGFETNITTWKFKWFKINKKHCYYKLLFNSICVNGCYLQCEESHPNMMDGNDENTLSWIQTMNWTKVHTKSFSYMFLCKLWELVKNGTNDNSFEYV